MKGFSELLTKLATDNAKRALDASLAHVTSIKKNISPHIESTFNKCNTIKTLLNPYSPASFLSIYTTQRFNCQNKPYDHFGMVDYIRSEKNNVIITGTGGSGKSMFTRYLWLSLFVESEGRIPLFIELRNMNSLSNADLKSYIFYSIAQGPGRWPEKDFNNSLQRGDLVIILDGFDELASDKREAVQKSIMSLAENYPSSKIVVTSRPDGRFTSWTSFHVVSMAPLLKNDVLELIDKSEFDPTSKAQFYRKVDSGGLFEKHSSFLSNPLLASMMLLTFSHNFDIPDKMHLFYEQAFDALYQRHDSHKPGGFKREFKTSLTEDNFKKLFSYFCLTSYYDQVFSFSHEEALDYIRKSIRLSGIKAEPEQWLSDLCESVCMLVSEGLDLSFSHRSFQEYFTAYCLSYVTNQNFAGFISRFAKRPNDQAILLLSDMNSEAFRKLYTLPAAHKFAAELQIGKRPKSVETFYRDSAARFEFRKEKVGKTTNYTITLTGQNEFFEFSTIMQKLAQKQRGVINHDSYSPDRAIRDNTAVRALWKAVYAGADNMLRIETDGSAFEYVCYKQDSEYAEISRASGGHLDDIFRKSYMYEFLESRIKDATAYINQTKKIDSQSSGAMEDFFGNA